MSSLESFHSSPFFSTKHTTYFQAYDELLSTYKDRQVTLVEVGVLSGGSLFMWRDYLGPKARIIGVDANPSASKWEASGFEIFIGDQGDERFWEQFFERVGNVDVLLDDGGHTYKQQITTAHCSIPKINDGGILIVEDTHTSYMDGFGVKNKSFIKWSYKFIDRMNRKFSGLKNGPKDLATHNFVWKLDYFESIVSFHVDRQKATLQSIPLSNNGKQDSAKDYRYSYEKQYLIKLAGFFDQKLSQGKTRFLYRLGLWSINRIRGDRRALKKLFNN